MDPIIEKVSRLPRVDFFFFGSSGQQHAPAYIAGGLRHFSNELAWRPDLIRYHPNMNDVRRWARQLHPRFIVPYAEFVFDGVALPDIKSATLCSEPALLRATVSTATRFAPAAWASDLEALRTESAAPLLMLQPMQGVRFEAPLP